MNEELKNALIILGIFVGCWVVAIGLIFGGFYVADLAFGLLGN